MKDASLKATPSLSGTVINTALYSKVAKESGRKGAKNDQKVKIEKAEDEFQAKAEALSVSIKTK